MFSIPKIEVGTFELINTERILINNSAVTITFDPNIIIEIRHIDNTKPGEHNAKTQLVGNKIIFELIDYNNSFGTGFIEPLEIGRYNSRKLYISFFSYVIDLAQKARVLDVNFLLGDKIE